MMRVDNSQRHALFDIAKSRKVEERAAAGLAPQILMQRAGLALARLALAVAPHARTIWLACGPGNNGGDGLEAAIHLSRWGKQVAVTWLGDAERCPKDSLAAWQRASSAGISVFDAQPPDLDAMDLCIDALLGLGVTRAPEGAMSRCIAHMNASPAPVLAVDVPSGLNPDTGTPIGELPTAGTAWGQQVRANWTLTFLTIKPGLFTGRGRDLAGQVWIDRLGMEDQDDEPSAWLAGPPSFIERAHASHKGDYGDTVIVGGATGMGGAALLAARAALHGGSGRVYLCPINSMGDLPLVMQPELMIRDLLSLDLTRATVVCGCGGGAGVAAVLPRVISSARRLLLDADALNAVAVDDGLKILLLQRAGRQRDRSRAILTPHPLEAARLLGVQTAEVQRDRLQAARQLAEKFQCVAVLKGSGTVIAAPGGLPVINSTGNARLATAGTGDVLAGMIGARLSSGFPEFDAACEAVHDHGRIADAWPTDRPLTASALAAFSP